MHQRFALLLCGALSSAGVSSATPREVTGQLVQPGSHTPIVGQRLELDRPSGNYPGFTMLLMGVPQPAAIATATTGPRGEFRFVVTNDRGRFLTVRLAGFSPADFRSSRGYAVERLADSLRRTPPRVRFDSELVRTRGGGFRARP